MATERAKTAPVRLTPLRGPSFTYHHRIDASGNALQGADFGRL